MFVECSVNLDRTIEIKVLLVEMHAEALGGEH